MSATTHFLELLFNQDQDLAAFALSCARGMSILGYWRDCDNLPDPLVPHPSQQQYVDKQRGVLNDLIVRWRDEGDAAGRAIRDREIAWYREQLERDEERGRKVEAMLAAVRTWQPPSADHAGLKDFMLQQLGVFSSMADWYRNQIAKLEAKPPSEIIAAQIAEAEQSLTYAEEEQRKTIERVRRARTWLAELRASLPPGEPAVEGDER